MARFKRGGNSRSQHTKKNVKGKTVLPKKGVSQTAYESGFFDFLMVFWRNNRKMNLFDLTKQVVNLWEALLPEPKISQKTLMRDYSKEFEALRREAEKERRDDFESNSSRSRSNSGEQSSNMEEDSMSGSDKERQNRKRKGRKYENYDDYISKTKSKPSTSGNEKGNNEKSTENVTKADLKIPKQKMNKQQNDELLLPSSNLLERMVNMKSTQPTEALGGLMKSTHPTEALGGLMKSSHPTEALGSLKICKPLRSDTYFMFNAQEVDDMDIVNDDDDDADSLLIRQPSHTHSAENRGIVEIVKPTKTLRVNNLIEGTTHKDLEETFRLFMDDIVSIKILNSKTEASAIVDFKSIEAAEEVWRQFNGMEFRKTSLDLEFVEEVCTTVE